jgi:RNA-directed DNA polymerase
MKGGKQKISRDTYQQDRRAEPESHVEGQTFIWITENNLTNINKPEYGLLEQILSPSNMNRAFKRVRSNKGSGGIDKMGEIPKEKGKKRALGIPTVVDRVIQQAIAQILSPVYEKQFSPNSYGFRPGRNAHQALNKCRSYITDGYKYAVDMDLEKFFDTVNQSKLIEVLSRTVKDGRVISLIHKYLNAGVVICNKFEETRLGVPQGGPLSPLLSNVMLNELDKELEKRGHRFVRYADDMVIFCKSKRSADRTLANIVPYIENKLFLKINREKTVTAYISGIKFLGYSLPLSHIDEWYRRRLRMVIWKQWKLVRTRWRNLIKLGINKHLAWEWANTRKGYWHIAKSHILSIAISNERLKSAGYLFFSDYYRSVKIT